MEETQVYIRVLTECGHETSWHSNYYDAFSELQEIFAQKSYYEDKSIEPIIASLEIVTNIKDCNIGFVAQDTKAIQAIYDSQAWI